MREKIAQLFRIAREEGPLIKWADGLDDADELLFIIATDLRAEAERYSQISGEATIARAMSAILNEIASKYEKEVE